MAEVIMTDFKPPYAAEQYDALDAKIDPIANRPQGMIFHSAGPSPSGGWRILDVWESKEDFDRFFAESVGPAMVEMLGEEALASEEPPEITSWTLHKHG